MAILTPAPSETAYALSGSTTGPFSTQWAYAAAEEVCAYLELAGVRAADLTRGADFTVSGGNPLVDGGAVTLDIDRVPVGGWGAGDRIVLYRLTPARQALALPDTEGHKPRATEQAFDRLTRAQQESMDRQARGVFTPVGEPALELEPAATRAGKPAGFDADGRLVAAAAYLPGSALVGALGQRILGRGDAASARADLSLGSAATRNVGVGAGQVAPAEALAGLASDVELQALAADVAELQVSGTALKAVAAVTDLAAIATPANNDRVEVRDDPAGDVPDGNGVWRYDTVATDWVWLGPLVPASLTDAVDEIGDRVDGLHPTSGDLLTSDTIIQGAPANGAVMIGVSPTFRGWTTPNGQTAVGTFILPRQLVDEATSRSWAGLTMRLTLQAAATAGFLTHQTIFDQGVKTTDRNGAENTVGTRIAHSQTGGLIVSVYELTWTGLERQAEPILQTFGGDGSGVQSYEVIGISLAPASPAFGAQTSSDLADRVKRDLMASACLAPLTVRSVRTVLVGAGQAFTTLSDAQAVLTDASASRRMQIGIRGRLTEKNVFRRAWVDYIGRSPALDGIEVLNPANVDPASTVSDTALWENDSGALRNLKARVRGARYVLHSDGGNGGQWTGGVPNNPQWKDTWHFHENLELIHDGNQEAYDYQVSLGGGGNPAAVWMNTCAFGAGSGSGQFMYQRNCVFTAPFVAWSLHDNIEFERPATHILDGCTLTSTSFGRALGLQAYGSGLVSSVIAVGCQFNGDIHIDAGAGGPGVGGSWFPTKLDQQPSDMNGHHLYGWGNSPAVFTISHHGRALKIESASVSGTSTVAVSGTAAAVLFGEVVSRPGAGGLKGYVYGEADISGMDVGPNKAGTSGTGGVSQLGKRLGDCSSVNKSLSVVVDGGSPIVVTFSANHTAQSNATVLGIINTALGAAATASAWDVGGRYRPRFTDEEKTLLNTSATGIPMGSVVAYDSAQLNPLRSVRLMTDADPASLYAGVAWEDIYPGQPGRVKTGGWLPLTDVRRADGAAVAFGATFSISPATPGAVIVGGTQGLLRAIRGDAAGAAVEVAL